MDTKPDKIEKTIKILKNCIIVPLLVFILFNTIFMLKAKGNHEVPAMYGYSVVSVKSNNLKSNFKQNSVVVVKSIPTSKLNVGNYIAFYDYERKDVNKQELEENVKDVTQQDNEKSNADIKELSFVNFLGGGATNVYQKMVAKQTGVDFKKITKISTITNPSSSFCGKRFFYTTDETATQGKWIMEDYVVGIYQKSSGLMGMLIKVFSHSVGTIVILVLSSLGLIYLIGKAIYIEFKKYLKSDDGDFDDDDEDEEVKEHRFKIRLKPKNKDENNKIKNKNIEKENKNTK